MLDNAGWFAVAAHYDNWLATTDLNIKYLDHAKGENLRAVGRTLRVGKKIAMAEMEVRTEEGRLLAVGSGTFALTSIEAAA